MTTAYQPQPGVHVGRPPCANCGAARRLHLVTDGSSLTCPTPARATDTLQQAIDGLRAGGSTSRRFLLRGEVQRQMDHRPGTCTPLCDACVVLLEDARR